MPKVFGLIGYPLSHSFSKKYFTEKFEKEGIKDCFYELFPLQNISELSVLLKNGSIKGLNVTIPYKEKVIPFLDEMDETAKAVAAVNCIAIVAEKKIGYNTDVIGFRQSIKPFLETRHERALILGTGGSSKAVAYVLKQIGIDCYFVTRDKSRFNGSNVFTYEEVSEYVINAFKLIVNTTPVGMFPEESNCPDIPYQYIGREHLLYDLVYNPGQTLFLKKGKERGAACVNGLSMLYQQAEASWKIWNK